MKGRGLVDEGERASGGGGEGLWRKGRGLVEEGERASGGRGEGRDRFL